MSTITDAARSLREAVEQHRPALEAVLERYRATNPRIFGSVARGDARDGSDIDVLVDLDQDGGNALLRVAGIGEEFSSILNVSVDVVADELLRRAVAADVHREAVPL